MSSLFASDEQNIHASAQHSSSNEYSELISFKIDWFDLFAVQGTLRSLLKHCSLKVSILWHSAFFTIQLSQPYVTIAVTIWTFVIAFQQTV